MAILNARTIAATAVYAENRLCCLVMGTNDLIKQSRARGLHDRFGVVRWLGMTLVAARPTASTSSMASITTSRMSQACARSSSVGVRSAWTARR